MQYLSRSMGYFHFPKDRFRLSISIPEQEKEKTEKQKHLLMTELLRVTSELASGTEWGSCDQLALFQSLTI